MMGPAKGSALASVVIYFSCQIGLVRSSPRQCVIVVDSVSHMN